MALRCSIRSVICGSSPVAFARTDNWGRPIPRRHTLTLIVSFFSLAPSSARAKKETGCVCLHALSSFQRTDFTGWSWGRPTPQPRRDRLLGRPCFGEPSKVTRTPSSCQCRQVEASPRALRAPSGIPPPSRRFPRVPPIRVPFGFCPSPAAASHGPSRVPVGVRGASSSRPWSF